MDPPSSWRNHQQLQDALMVVDNHQVQVWSAFNGWPQPPQGGAAPRRCSHVDGAYGCNWERRRQRLTRPRRLPQPRRPPPPCSMQEKVEPQRKKKCTFKKRKATHTIRKEQKAALEKEIEAL
ncbi:hypothetical protein ON010_g8167 [Phytophthora cinnamomi]|nr:hypothetical protein ON010_g8167 [Phytophthora cinnamomi]